MSKPRKPPALRGALAVAAAALASLIGASPAAAGSLIASGGNFEFDAKGGIANRVTVTASAGSLKISDSADTITTAVAGCNGSGTNTVECVPLTPFASLSLDLDSFAPDSNDDTLAVNASIPVEAFGRRGNDTLSSSGPGPFDARGEEGADQLSGGDGNDHLSGDQDVDSVSGGAGNDVVQGGPADGDTVEGGSGNDLFPAGAGDGSGDVYRGGTGVDQALYLAIEAGPPPGYAVDLGAGTGGPAGEIDSLAEIEDVTTFQGEDTVTGSAGANRISTASDLELLFILFGISEVPLDAGDTVNPLAGPDFVATGGGNDILNLVDGYADRADCGAGTDTVQADQLDELIDCEGVTTTRVDPAGADRKRPSCRLTKLGRRYKPRAFGRGIRATVRCNEAVTLEAQLTGRLAGGGKRRAAASRAGDLVLAERRIRASRATHTVRLRPSRRLRALLGASFKAQVRVVATDGAGNRAAVTRGIVVKPGRRKR